MERDGRGRYGATLWGAAGRAGLKQEYRAASTAGKQDQKNSLFPRGRPSFDQEQSAFRVPRPCIGSRTLHFGSGIQGIAEANDGIGQAPGSGIGGDGLYQSAESPVRARSADARQARRALFVEVR